MPAGENPDAFLTTEITVSQNTKTLNDGFPLKSFPFYAWLYWHLPAPHFFLPQRSISKCFSQISGTVSCLEWKNTSSNFEKNCMSIYLATKTGVTFNKKFILPLLEKITSAHQSDTVLLKIYLVRKYSLWNCTQWNTHLKKTRKYLLFSPTGIVLWKKKF